MQEVITFRPSPSSEVVKGILATKTSRVATLVFQGYLFIYFLKIYLFWGSRKDKDWNKLLEVMNEILPKHLKKQGSLPVSYELISSFTPIVCH